MAAANDALRFVLELVGIGAAAYWGYHATGGTVPRLALAVGAPAALVVVWAFVVAPGADNPIAPTPRMLIGSALLLLAAVGLWVAGQPVAAAAFAVVNVVNTAVASVVGG